MIYVLFKQGKMVDFRSDAFAPIAETTQFISTNLATGNADEVKTFNTVDEFRTFLIQNDVKAAVDNFGKIADDFCAGLEKQITQWGVNLEKHWLSTSLDAFLEQAKSAGADILDELRKTKNESKKENE